jgi:di/tricarboxylate transporter
LSNHQRGGLSLAQLPEGIGGLILVAAWVVGGVAPAAVALSGFSSATWMLLVGIMAVGAAVSNSGLLYRISLSILARGGKRFGGQVAALMAAGLLVGPAMPNAAAGSP